MHHPHHPHAPHHPHGPHHAQHPPYPSYPPQYGYYDPYYRRRWYHYILPDPAVMDEETKRIWRGRIIKLAVMTVILGLLILGGLTYGAYRILSSDSSKAVGSAVRDTAQVVATDLANSAAEAKQRQLAQGNEASTGPQPATTSAPANAEQKPAQDSLAVTVIEASADVAKTAIEASVQD